MRKFIGFVCLVVLVGWGYSARTHRVPRAPSAPRTVTKVDFVRLSAAYNRNRAQVQATWGGRLIETTGFTSGIQTRGLPHQMDVSVSPHNPRLGRPRVGHTGNDLVADCRVPRVDFPGLYPGQPITVRGTVGDLSSGILTLNNCHVGTKGS